MISNSSSYKLKASKSSRDLHDYQNSQTDDYEEDNTDGDINDGHSRYNVYGSRDGRYKSINKLRQTEFRSSRGSERRNNYRGRGGGATRRGDRDFSESGSYVLSNKYHDSLTRNLETSAGIYHPSKCYDTEKKVEIKLNLPEDTRISKLLRRLSLERNQENSLIISKKLLEVLLIPDNANYIRKSFHILGESMMQILNVAPGPLAKQQAARALGRMGYIMAQEEEFERYQTWLFSRMETPNEEMKYLYMKSLTETLAFEKRKPKLLEHSTSLMHALISTIESTENVDLFQVVLDNLMTLVEMYPEDFNPQFSNMMDVLFGWHVDPSQPLCNIEFISKNVQRISKHFKVNLTCSLTLIVHFMDDIESFSKQLLKKNGNADSDDAMSSSIEQVTVTILALNTVLKCLDNNFHLINNNKQVDADFIIKSLNLIIKTATVAMEKYVPDSLVIASNDSIMIFLGILGIQANSLSKSLYALMDLELSLISEFSDATIVSMLLLISKVVKELSANLPSELIGQLVGPKSEILKLRYSPFINVQEATICVYQTLLNLKNIPLLQEAYKYILGDLEVIYKKIVPNIVLLNSNNPFDEVYCDIQQAELTVLFLLRCLSQLANASSSIIGMWALKPSILELLGVLLEPYNVLLAQNAPSLQYSLLHLLYAHCKCYNHFITRSSMVVTKQDKSSVISMGLSGTIENVATKSPSSENFAIILHIVCKTLDMETTSETKLLLLYWLNDILINCEVYLEVLYNNDKFKPVAEILVKCGYNYSDKIVLIVCENLEKLLCNKQLCWSNTFLVMVSDLCKLHMNSHSSEVCKRYTNLAANIPWDIAVVEFNKMNTIEDVQRHTNLNDYNNSTVTLAQHLHLNGTVFGEITPLQFKIFMQHLLNNEVYGDNWLEDLFSCCWPLESDSETNMEQFRDLALNSRIVLSNWCTWEAAQFCVNSKLRTPLGKPNETFTKIEGALKQLAKDVTQKVTRETDDELKTFNQRHVRLLLQFMEHLEKCIYNASEGCAIALQQPSKPVRTFFYTNSSTCHEWLTRIRLIVINVALHVGESCTALRHGQLLLKELVSSNKSGNVEFERAVMYVTLALLKLHEPEAIQGLYVWCKNVSSRKFWWIKCAIEQAAKKYENAVQGYADGLANLNDVEDTKKTTDANVENFISDQIVNSYKELNNWIDLKKYKADKMYGCNLNGIRPSLHTVDWNCVENLYNLEIGTYAFNDLAAWKEIEEERCPWSIYDVLRKTETNLYKIALNITAIDVNNLNDINNTMSVIQNRLVENVNSLPSDFLQTFTLLYYVANGLKNILNNTPANSVFLVSEDFENEIDKIDCSVLSKTLWWSEYFEKIQNQGSSTFCNNLRLNIIRKARKEKNFNLACDQISNFLKDKELWNENGQPITVKNITTIFMQKIPEMNAWTLDLAKVVMEVIKLAYSNEDNHQFTFNLCASASTAISKYAELYGGKEFRQISSKILLKLANWLQTNDQISLTEINSQLGKLLMVLPEISLIDGINSDVIPLNEMAVGKLLHFSVNQCVGLAKSWNAFGTWCYRWGRKIVDHSPNLKSGLKEDDIATIKGLLPIETTSQDLTKILSILSQTRAVVDEEDIDSNEINTSEMILNQLQSVPALQYAHENQLEQLVNIWRNVQKRVYAYYQLSAEAYFKYLHLASDSDNLSKGTDCDTIIVTLRLLRLIVKHALELQHVLEEGLETTPTHPWKVIVPQLFSRLNHPESYVRHRVSELLRRVAEDAPHLITFPAVVGALEGGLKFDFSEITLPKDCLSQNNDCNDDGELNEIEDNYDSDKEECKNVLQACFKSMVDTLSKQAPETINQVQMLVQELRRITLLWDELWLGTLAQHQNEISRRQQQLEMEIEKVNDNQNLTKEEKITLIAEKHRIIIKPIIFVLEQLHDITSVEPETPHEKQFQEKYFSTIKDVLEKLKNPENPDKPQESWKPLKELQKKFQQKFHKRASYSLKMCDISPILAVIRNTVIAMPGLSTSSRTPVTITSVSNHVSILPTKTKPKKLIFCGSDGRKYTYLFKGLEDLHLDERIMQFLSIANTMMAHNSLPSENNLYRARHYSVIPLGPRSGLISWVDGTTPVFALYKRWQQREAAKVMSKTVSNPNTSVLRPSELFYNKLNPLLKEHGVKNIENRKEWPLVVLKQVLTELMAETPSDLLARELWCHSINACTWWQVVKKYSYSVAVMSIIGYIIGLGDRHLDNVLVDLTSGEVVHIDYNVCFEKGKTLRVPEKVPFRLTPNIRDALGITSVEGIFRLACENVLKTMKKGRETLLTLLEAFVYDPLIDWTTGNEVLAGTSFGGLAGNTLTLTRQSRKDLEREVTLSMFHVRCTEMKTEWNTNKTELIEDIPKVIEKFKLWIEYHQKVTKTEDFLQDLHQQMALVKEAEAHGINKHPLYTLPSRYEVYRKTQDAITTAKNSLHKLIEECESHLKRYTESLGYISGQQLSQWFMELNTNVVDDDGRVFDLVKEFLQNAGQTSMISQCEQSENDVAQLVQQQNLVAKKCLQLLQDYSNVLAQCPSSFNEKHRTYLYLKWCKYLEDTGNITACDKVYDQFCAFLEPSKYQNVKAIFDFSYGLNIHYNDIAAQANTAYDEYAKYHAQNSTVSLEKAYDSAQLGISTFLMHEKGAAKALEFVIISELLVLNTKILHAEASVNRNGEWLLKLKPNGDWFLQELITNSNRTVEFLNILHLQGNTDEPRIIETVRIVNNLFKSLQDLSNKFHTIILPETMKKIQNEEVSTIHMIGELNNLVLSMGTSIPELVLQLEKLLPCILMQMDLKPSHEFILDRVSELKTKYYSMIVNSQLEVLNQGKMLLIGFNGLFDKLNQELNNLVNSVGSLEIPTSWRKINLVKEAKSIAAHIFNPKVKAVLEDIFLLKRLHAISKFFTLCVEMTQSFKGVAGTAVVFNDEELLKPVRKYIKDFVCNQLLGISTEMIVYLICFLLEDLGMDVTNEIEQKDFGAENIVPLDELVQKGWSTFIKCGLFTSNVFSQASSLENNLKVAWENLQEPKRLEQQCDLLKSSILRVQGQLTAHNFIFEDVLKQQPYPQSVFSFVRGKFVMDLRQEITSINMLQLKLKEAHEQQKTLIASAEQRLKWAAGANPDLNEVLSAFESGVNKRENRLDLEQNIVTIVLSTCNTILQHELLRTQSPESAAFDKHFLNSCEKWRAVCQCSGQKILNLSPTEENMVKLFASEIIIGTKWLTTISEKITEMISTSCKELSDYKSDKFIINDAIHTVMGQLKSHYSKHCRLMSDVKLLIKSMTKIDDYCDHAQTFISDYRNYTDNFTPFLTFFKKEVITLSVEEMTALLNNLYYLKEHTEYIYDSLMNLKENNSQKNGRTRPIRQEDVFMSPLKAIPIKQESTTKGQQRNVYAVGVWRRVRMKLEGKDPDPGRKYTPQEQVDYVIREATNLDNLALLYEGWTPWV